ncbi:hypothetical protein [Serratia fonticola]|uniref:hypothetical protein n=1 Tax=Serratia fonticola TaxID=47917 RepID=UPI003AF333C6
MMEAVKRSGSSILQRKRKYLSAVIALALCFFAKTALADGGLMVCDWGELSSRFIKPGSTLNDVIGPAIQDKYEKYDCDIKGENCSYRYYWNIPNRTYTVTASATVNCLNLGETTTSVKLSFSQEYNYKPRFFRNLTMSITGAGSLFLSGLENPSALTRTWSDGTLAPCKTNCYSLTEGWPRYSKKMTFTFSVQPIKSRVDGNVIPHFDNINTLGVIWVHLSSDNPVSSFSYSSTSMPIICGLEFTNLDGCKPSVGNGGAGPIKPPVPTCTLTVNTPDVVEFQPISSDDLSRNRVRMEDFTLTVTKGPVQSQTCLGSTYNLPGTIKT